MLSLLLQSSDRKPDGKLHGRMGDCLAAEVRANQGSNERRVAPSHRGSLGSETPATIDASKKSLTTSMPIGDASCAGLTVSAESSSDSQSGDRESDGSRSDDGAGSSDRKSDGKLHGCMGDCLVAEVRANQGSNERHVSLLPVIGVVWAPKRLQARHDVHGWSWLDDSGH
ncbi:hypothetical protein V6N13_034159 [Hibiscus sabdariffa]